MKSLNLILILCSLSFVVQAQSAKEFFSNSDATLSFVGLDFSEATMVGTGESASKNKDMYEVWNSLMVSESDKFDVNKAFRRSNEPMRNIEITDVVNKKVDEENINSHSSPKKRFDKSKIQALVNAYNTDEIEAEYAVSFIIHSFSKGDERAIIYVTLFNPKTKEVLWLEEMETEPSGFGYKSYWVGTVYDVVKTIKKKYKKWAKDM
jgi:hypothetical protein